VTVCSVAFSELVFSESVNVTLCIMAVSETVNSAAV
jgi:hypothetical protein